MNRWRFLLLIISIASPLFASDGERSAGKNFVMYIQEQNGYPPYAFRTREGSYLSISQREIIRKISESGELLWQRTVSIAPSTEQYVSLDGIAETVDGYLVCGSTVDWNDGIPNAGVIVKLGTDGSIQWSKRFESQEKVGFRSIILTTDGGFIVQGYSWDHRGTAVLVKITANGDRLWSKIFDDLRVLDSISVSDGIILASRHLPLRMIKINDSGSVIWQVALQSKGFQLQSIAASSDNGVILAGKSFQNLMLIQISSDGKIDWNAAYLFKDSWFGISSVAATSDHGYVVLGTKFSDENDKNPSGFVVKINSKQQLVFQKKFGRSDRNEYARKIFTIADEGYAIFGQSKAENGWHQLFLNVNSEGTVPGCSFFSHLRLQKVSSPVVRSRSHEITSRNLALAVGTIEMTLNDSTTPSSTMCSN